MLGAAHSIFQEAVTCETLAALSRNAYAQTLQELRIEGQQCLGLHGFRCLAQSRLLGGLKLLSLKNSLVLNRYLEELFSGEHAPGQLRILNLKNCRFLTFEGGFEHCLGAGLQRTLEILDVRGSGIGGTEFSVALFDFQRLVDLNRGSIELTLAKNSINNEETLKLKTYRLVENFRRLNQIVSFTLRIEKLKPHGIFLERLSEIFEIQDKNLSRFSLEISKVKKLAPCERLLTQLTLARRIKVFSLQLDFVHLEVGFVRSLIQSLQMLVLLEELTLVFQSCKFTYNEDVGHLCKPLIRLQNLHTFRVSFNSSVSASLALIQEFISVPQKLDRVQKY